MKPKQAAGRKAAAVPHGRRMGNAAIHGEIVRIIERPPSWHRAEVHHPTAGAFCAVCDGQRWWSRDKLNWCCMSCHPPSPSADTLHTVDTAVRP